MPQRQGRNIEREEGEKERHIGYGRQRDRAERQKNLDMYRDMAMGDRAERKRTSDKDTDIARIKTKIDQHRDTGRETERETHTQPEKKSFRGGMTEKHKEQNTH